MDTSVFSGRADELTGRFLVQFEWWQCTAAGNQVPRAGALDELEGIAIEHIHDMVLENYTEGELFHVLDNDVFRGYWKYQTY